jgi:hypothetical protein
MKDAEDNEKGGQKQEETKPPPQIPAFPYSGSIPSLTANPAAQQIVNLVGGMQSIRFDKEPNPEVVRMQLDALTRVSDNLNAETMKSYELQGQRDRNLYDVVTKREARDHRITIIVLGAVLVLTGVGVVLLFLGTKTEGTALIIAGLSAILGFLGGLGASKKGINP